MLILRNVLFWSSIAFSIVGFIILGFFLFKVSSFYTIATTEINIADTANIGVFIGGAVGTIWSLVSVLLFYLNLQQQGEAISTQQGQIDHQQFEATFFNLLRTQQEIRSNIYDRYSTSHQDLFEVMAIDIKDIYINKISEISKSNSINISGGIDSPGINDKIAESVVFLARHGEKFRERSEEASDLELVKSAYWYVFDQHHNQVGHYFRNLYHTLKFVSDSYENEIGRQTSSVQLRERIIDKYNGYSGFIQAQMSSSELLVLFYNALCFEETKKLLHKFNFLENLAKEDLLKPEHETFYEEFTEGDVTYPKISFKSRPEI